MRQPKFRAIYQSPDTDEPNKIMIGEPITLQEIFHGSDTQIDFTDGGYLRFHEMEEEYTKWDEFTGEFDADDKEVCEGDVVQCQLWDDELNGTAVVKYADGRFYLADYDEDNFPMDFADRFFKFTIIGDIHTTPELIK